MIETSRFNLNPYCGCFPIHLCIHANDVTGNRDDNDFFDDSSYSDMDVPTCKQE